MMPKIKIPDLTFSKNNMPKMARQKEEDVQDKVNSLIQETEIPKPENFEIQEEDEKFLIINEDEDTNPKNDDDDEFDDKDAQYYGDDDDDDDDDEDDYDMSKEQDENELELEDLDILESDSEGTKLRLILKDGTWKNLYLNSDIIKALRHD